MSDEIIKDEKEIVIAKNDDNLESVDDNSEADAEDKKKKLIPFIIAGACLIIIILAMVIAFSGGKNKKDKNIASSPEATLSVTEASTNTPSPTEDNDVNDDVTIEPTTTSTSTPTPTSTPEPTEEAISTPAATEAPASTPEVSKPSTESGTPVSNHGKLKLSGTQIVDKNGKAYQLKGVSTHGLQWFPQYVNKDAFKSLRDDWGVNVVRLAMYTHEGGYCDGANKDDLKQLVNNGVSYATDLGMYVIIDWHVLNEQYPSKYQDEAISFFKEMSKKYADYDNVIYEICNEPNSGPSWSDVKSYAEEVIPAIRANDDDAIIIVGTPTWSQDVDKAASDPITGYDNIMYALHFYAATHTDWLRDRMNAAIDAGLPVFVSEYGICDASGNGGNDISQANAWVEAMNKKGVSYVCWNLANKNESSSLINSSVSKTSGWDYTELSEEGKWLVDILGGKISKGQSGGSTSSESGSSEGGSSSNSSSSGNSSSTNPQPGSDNGSNQNSITASKITYSGDVVVAEENGWSGNEGYSHQLSVSYTNSGSKIESWTITLNFDKVVSLDQFWCCSASLSNGGKTVTVTPEDWNKTIESGGQISNVGIVVSANSDVKITSGKISTK